jgi:hypothetical protein
MTSANRNEFIEALERTQFFANYELMLVEDQHVVDYALTEPRAAFLALTGRRVHNEAYLKKFGKAFDPGNALVWAQKLGLPHLFLSSLLYCNMFCRCCRSKI